MIVYRAVHLPSGKSYQWEILWQGNDADEMAKQERHFIEHFNSLVPEGFNVSRGGGGIRDIQHPMKVFQGRIHPETRSFIERLSKLKNLPASTVIHFAVVNLAVKEGIIPSQPAISLAELWERLAQLAAQHGALAGRPASSVPTRP